MKKYCSILVAIQLLFFSCKKNNPGPQEQPPANTSFVKFKKVYGGSNYDAITTATPAIDGGYVLTGLTQSNNGDVTGTHGFDDLWLMKISDSGSVVWSKTYGGSNDEFSAFGLVPMSDGYILARATTSTDGNVSISKDDYRQHWLIKTDMNGDILWQKKFSNLAGAQIICLIKAKNGDIVGGGYVFSGGPQHAWLFRLTANGNLIWEKTYDALTETIVNVAESANGDLIATGRMIESNNPDQVDALLIRTTSTGDVKWLKSFGGSLIDNGSGVLATSDGGALMTGLTISTDGHATGNHGNEDILAIKVDEQGNVEWNKVFGGTAGESDTRALFETSDHRYVLTATSYSKDGDMPSPQEFDAWILTLNAEGSIVDKKRFGGEGLDIIYHLLPLGDGKILAAGLTTSLTGDFSGAHGGYEGWVFTLE